MRVVVVGTAGVAPAVRRLQAGPFSAEQIEAVETALAPALHPPTAWQRQAADATGEPQFWLRVEQPDAALRQQLQQRVADVPGSRLSACSNPR